MSEMIYIKIGEMNAEKNDGTFRSAKGREVSMKKDFDTVSKTFDGRKYVGLKAYHAENLHKEDLKIIKAHNTSKAVNGVEYYTFTRGRSLEEIKHVKEAIIKRMKDKAVFPVKNIEGEDTIFGTINITFTIPKFIIEKQDTTEEIGWNCWDDVWKHGTHETQEREFIEMIYKNKGKLRRTET